MRKLVSSAQITKLEELVRTMLPHLLPDGSMNPAYYDWFDKDGGDLKTDQDWILSQTYYLLSKSRSHSKRSSNE